ncbi:hypothetical protein L9F63_024276, partial [Diploptera punctata]
MFICIKSVENEVRAFHDCYDDDDFLRKPEGEDCRRREAKRGMFPYIAGIETEIETFYGLRTAECTGTIIAARWILTAGHCLKIEHYITTRVRYTVGEINILRNLKPALRYVVHPNYSFERTYVLFIPTDVVHDDIGLIKTKEEIQFDKFITNVCISSNDQLSANPVCFVAGFGKLVDPLEVTYEKSYLLHFATLDYTEERPIIPNTIELSVKGKYPSLGDSGGPLMCDGKQIGIFSKVGASLNQAKLTYTQCGKYKNWIESITGTKVLDT